MDRRLREYADRWRATTPTPRIGHFRRTAGHGRGRTWWIVGLSAAAVLAGIVGGSLVVARDGGAAPLRPAVSPGGIVPWAPSRTTRPQIPTQTTPASPDPAEAIGKPKCRASDLRASTRIGAAAGTSYLSVTLSLSGSRTCQVQGWPNLEFMDGGGQPIDIPVVHQDDSETYHDPVLVAPGQPALLRLGWSSAWCTTAVRNDMIVLILRNYLLAFPGFGGSPGCNGTPGSGPTPIRVGAFQPAKTRAAVVRSAYSGVRVTGDLDIDGELGKSTEFIVTLTSSRPIVLDPCPDYEITQAQATAKGLAPPKVETFALNCEAVPYRTTDGNPYLPAGTPVQFAMRTITSFPGAAILTWALNVPDDVTVSGTITGR